MRLAVKAEYERTDITVLYLTINIFRVSCKVLS
jgi:hypothetical protein